jgi:glycosyltransferase involved in cell wall biosynthesis
MSNPAAIRDASLDLTIGITCFNEERNLPLLLDDLRRQHLPSDLRVEFLIVDDASNDHTPIIAQEAARRDTRIRVIRHARRTGGSSAWNTVLEEARGELLIRIDGDVRLLDNNVIAVLIAEHASDLVPTVRSAKILPFPPYTLVQRGTAFIYEYLAAQNAMGHATSATLFCAEFSAPRLFYANFRIPTQINSNDFYLARWCAVHGWPITVSRGARFFVKSSATLTDFRRQQGRCRSFRAPTLALLGTWRKPRLAMLPAMVVTMLRRPIGFIVFLAIHLLCLCERAAPTPIWEPSQSTK